MLATLLIGKKVALVPYPTSRSVTEELVSTIEELGGRLVKRKEDADVVVTSGDVSTCDVSTGTLVYTQRNLGYMMMDKYARRHSLSSLSGVKVFFIPDEVDAALNQFAENAIRNFGMELTSLEDADIIINAGSSDDMYISSPKHRVYFEDLLTELDIYEDAGKCHLCGQTSPMSGYHVLRMHLCAKWSDTSYKDTVIFCSHCIESPFADRYRESSREQRVEDDDATVFSRQLESHLKCVYGYASKSVNIERLTMLAEEGKIKSLTDLYTAGKDDFIRLGFGEYAAVTLWGELQEAIEYLEQVDVIDSCVQTRKDDGNAYYTPEFKPKKYNYEQDLSQYLKPSLLHTPGFENRGVDAIKSTIAFINETLGLFNSTNGGWQKQWPQAQL